MPIAVAVLLLAPRGHAQASGRLDFTQITRPVVEVTDQEAIDFLLFELFIEPLQPPIRLQVIDVTLNGYGPDDVIVVYPSVEAFLIPALVPDSVQQVMSAWVPEVEYKLDSGNLPSDALAALIGSGSDTAKRAEKAILYDVVQAVERNYRDLPVGILYERDSVGFTFQIWDYNPPAMQYIPRPTFDSDSTVQEVLELLKDVGYLPGQSAVGGGAVFSRPTDGVASVAKVLLDIRVVPDEQTRQMAARTVLLGSYDFDRSGSIDAAREIDAIPCDVWAALDAAFPGFLYRFGFTDPAGPYFGSMLFGLSVVIRGAAADRGVACLEGRAPPTTNAVAATPTPRPTAIPARVTAFLPEETAADVVRSVGSAEPGSAVWAAAVKSVLLEHFDSDRSGSLDRTGEVESVPCEVWRAVVSTHEPFLPDLGFTGSATYLGERVGVAVGLRDAVTRQVTACRPRAQPRTSRRVRAEPPPIRPASRPTVWPAVATTLASLSAMEVEEERQVTVRAVLLSSFDADRSGYIDTAAELDAMSCDVWKALDLAFPGFAVTYGFTAAEEGTAQRYRGSIIFNISARLRGPAGRRATACLRDEVPPPTDPADVRALDETIRIPPALQEFLDTDAAVRIARGTLRLEPGSAAWASAVRSVLLAEYDLDRSGLLDTRGEIDAVPCIVWETVQATYGGSLFGLGFGESGQYFGDRVGIAERTRVHAGRRISACAS
jgi:hypothetical protein